MLVMLLVVVLAVVVIVMTMLIVVVLGIPFRPDRRQSVVMTKLMVMIMPTMYLNLPIDHRKREPELRMDQRLLIKDGK